MERIREAKNREDRVRGEGKEREDKESGGNEGEGRESG